MSDPEIPRLIERLRQVMAELRAIGRAIEQVVALVHVHSPGA